MPAKPTGQLDVGTLLQNVPNVLRKNLQSILRPGAVIIRDEAIAGVRKVSGKLAASIRVIYRKVDQPGRITVSVVAGAIDRGKTDAYYAPWVEKGHIVRRKGQALKGGDKRKKAERAQHVLMGGQVVKAYPYMARALANKQGAALSAIKDAFEKFVAETDWKP